MALVKKSKIAADAAKPKIGLTLPAIAAVKQSASKGSGIRRNQTISERVAAATQQLASGLTEGAAATTELARSMGQIASGAEEAAGAAQEQSTALKRIVANLARSRSESEICGARANDVLTALLEIGTQISSSVRAIERNAERHVASVAVISELERRASDIAAITITVSGVADQINLLALNAAIEAARAGDAGRGFAVVADEVRTLAEACDKSAMEVQKLAASIQTDVEHVVATLNTAAGAAANEAKAAVTVVAALEARRNDMLGIAEDSRGILGAAVDAERGASEVAKGAEQIATAAEEQSSGAAEAQVAVQQQAKSLEQSQVAARTLAKLADDLRDGKVGRNAAEQISSSAEELSATIQEISSAATEVMAAIEQINRACRVQASATEQTSAALSQIEKGARLGQRNGRAMDERVRAMDSALESSRASVDALIKGVASALEATQASQKTAIRLESFGRKIDKLVGAIAMVAIQTSMLAVSGAVEAARAGDAGRGFSVVSNDIRALAREASENVERASDIVRGILDQVVLLQGDLTQIVTSTEVEVQNNRTVAASLPKIGIEVEALRKASGAIVEGSEAILEAAIQAAEGARQIAAAAEEASVATRDASTAAAEQSQGAENLAAAIEEIASLADELEREVA